MKMKLHQIIILGCAGLASFAVFGDVVSPPAQSSYNDLAQKYAAANAPFTVQGLAGTYLGSCFLPNSDAALGTLLSTNSGDGPLFPEFLRMSLLNIINSDGSAESPEMDAAAQTVQVQSFWSNPEMNRNGTEYPVEVSGITFSAQSPVTATGVSITNFPDTDCGKNCTVTFTETTHVRKGSDGYFYVLAQEVDTNNLNSQSDSGELYCYFWKKLF